MSDLDRILKLAGQAPQSPAPATEVVATEREMKPVAQEAVGESAEGIWELCDELECAEHPVFNELVRYLSGDVLQDFVKDFKQHNDMNSYDEAAEAPIEEATGVCGDCGCTIDQPVEGCECTHDSHDASGDHWVAETELEEAKAKPDFLDVDKDGDKDEPMKKAIKDKKVDEAEELEEAQSPAQKAAFAKMLASNGGKKDDEDDEVDEAEELEEVAVADDDLEELEESPTMDTTQLVNIMKNSGLSEEAIQKKLNEWANTPDGAAEEESTSHGDAYDWAQNVNLSLKRYLDAEDMKVGLKEHTVEELKEAYKTKKEQ